MTNGRGVTKTWLQIWYSNVSIATNRSDRLEQDAHFDTRQFQHITWEDADHFAAQACDWIEAILINNLERPS